MKNSFSFFKNKGLTYLAIALCVVSLPLYANDCSCGNNNDCHCAQISQDENDEESSKKFEWTTPIEKVVDIGYDAYEYMPIMRGPLLMASAPLFGTCLALLVTEGDSFKRKFWAVPCFSTLITGFVFGYGVGQTLTLGNLNN